MRKNDNTQKDSKLLAGSLLKSDAKQFKLGDGRISGCISLSLGLLSLLAVLAYLFPSYLTTTELRHVYDAEQLQTVLKLGMFLSLAFGSFTLLRNHHKAKGISGIALTLCAFALGGYNLPVGEVEAIKFSLGVDWLILSFITSVLVFTTLEKLFPKYRDQLILRNEWTLDIYYFVFNHLIITGILLFANYHTSHFSWAMDDGFQNWVQSMPVLMQFVLAVLLADFVLYWEHRLYHEIKLLWPIHAVHHSVEQLDWLAGSRSHFIQTFSERAMVVVALYLLGVEKSALDAYVVLAAFQAVLIHCNTKLDFGLVKFVLVTPQFHHWHHSSESVAIDTNYSAHTVIFDRLFGTYHMPTNQWPEHYGTTKPVPKTVLGQLLYPITAWFEK
jgi:lathosterol oxidase